MELAVVAKNPGPVSGLAKPFPGGDWVRGQETGSTVDRDGFESCAGRSRRRADRRHCRSAALVRDGHSAPGRHDRASCQGAAAGPIAGRAANIQAVQAARSRHGQTRSPTHKSHPDSCGCEFDEGKKTFDVKLRMSIRLGVGSGNERIS